MAEKYYQTDESVNEYIKLAKGYDGRELIEKLKIVLPAKSSVLEIGVGPGTDLEILNEYFEVVGSDFSSKFLDLIIEKHPNYKLLLLDAVTLKTKKRFDGIYSNKVLQHLTDNELKESINNQYRILNENAIICHSFWEGENIEIIGGIIHNYHTNDELEKLFSKQFEIVHLENYSEMSNDDSILLIGKKI